VTLFNLHTLNVIHGNVTLKNIFITKHDIIKIGDYGISESEFRKEGQSKKVFVFFFFFVLSL
jgi:tRNA A-37 threonylcarbamoyl transferase component Bud32